MAVAAQLEFARPPVTANKLTHEANAQESRRCGPNCSLEREVSRHQPSRSRPVSPGHSPLSKPRNRGSRDLNPSHHIDFTKSYQNPTQLDTDLPNSATAETCHTPRTQHSNCQQTNRAFQITAPTMWFHNTVNPHHSSDVHNTHQPRTAREVLPQSSPHSQPA